MTAPYSFHAYLCIQCDERWGSGRGDVSITMCEPCFRKYRAKTQDESKFLKVECRAEREAVYSVFRRMMEQRYLRTI